MSHHQQVATAVCEMKRADLRTLANRLPHLNHQQIKVALGYAYRLKLVSRITEQKSLGRGKGTQPGTYGPPDDPEQLPRELPKARRHKQRAQPATATRYASVWDYAIAAANEHHRRAA